MSKVLGFHSIYKKIFEEKGTYNSFCEMEFNG